MDRHLCVFRMHAVSEQTSGIYLLTSGSGSSILDYCLVSPIMAEVVLSQAQNQAEVPLVEKVSTPSFRAVKIPVIAQENADVEIRMENSSTSTSLFDFGQSAHISIPGRSNCTCLDNYKQSKRKIKMSLLYHTEDLTLGQKRRTRSLTIPAPSFREPSRLSPTSPKTGLRCLPFEIQDGFKQNIDFQ